MTIDERITTWLSFNQRPCEERDLLNDAVEELAALRERLDTAEIEIDTLKAEDPAKYAWMHACDDLAKECKELKAQLHAAGDGDTWKAACKRVEAELSTITGQLAEARALLLKISECDYLIAARALAKTYLRAAEAGGRE